ncbi:sulfur oxidation c-type cytochrome SoxX [Rhodovulum adriaticum]|uniref:Sulfur-oxidizing protein SoxX n=1 Tax=Rhodovulum adriaticum TaxID=35804 RepID=A0A4V2SLE8_RHOAD|nr:sulfur oxidation c-type cytochrome SoxX [Rhodovulum adriaticum]MBK1634445.1 sulfur oxidation c-type cytochrome SoxX [Rhodovulum adriaticum]TCP23186.1 sulfur-oxidizing protein SoxX [Rhodovulum adriaticum]
MKKAALGALVLMATTGLATAEVVAPGEVVMDEYGFVPAPLTDQPGDPERGRKIVGTKSLGNCVSCHQITEMSHDVPFHGEVGPMLDGLPHRYPVAMIRGILVNSKNVFDGTVMPAYYKTDGFIRPGNGYTGKAAEGAIEPLLSAQQIEDVIAYLLTLEDE